MIANKNAGGLFSATHLGQTVGTEQQHVFVQQRQVPDFHINFAFAYSNRVGENVAQVMSRNLVLRDLTEVCQHLRVRLIARQLQQPATAKEIRARVADAANKKIVARTERAGERGTHPGLGTISTSLFNYRFSHALNETFGPLRHVACDLLVDSQVPLSKQQTEVGQRIDE